MLGSKRDLARLKAKTLDEIADEIAEDDRRIAAAMEKHPFPPTLEEWTAMSDEVRLEYIEAGSVDSDLFLEAYEKGSGEFQDACCEMYSASLRMVSNFDRQLAATPRSRWDELRAPYDEAMRPFKFLGGSFSDVVGEALAAIKLGMATLSLDSSCTVDAEGFDVLARRIRARFGDQSIPSDPTPSEITRFLLKELARLSPPSDEKRQQYEKRRWAQLPNEIPQQTWPEARNMAIALADGPSGRGWQDIVGEIALRHVRADDPIQIKLVAGPSIDWWGMPATHELLRNELREMGVDAALLLNEVLYLALAQPGEMVPLDTLVEAIGWDPRSSKEKQECRRRLWRTVSVFENMLATGQRRGLYPDPDTKKKTPVAIVDRLVTLGPRLMPEQQAFDNSVPPYEISFKPGDALERYRGNRKVLTDYGNVRRIASIPAKQPSGRWARAIGLTLNQLWRQESKRAVIKHSTHGDQKNELQVQFKPFTRRELLTEYYKAVPYVEDILNGTNPKRAREYWDGAIQHLKLKKVIKSCTPLSKISDGDKTAWLDQPLDIRPEYQETKDTIEILKAHARVKRKPIPKNTAKN